MNIFSHGELPPHCAQRFLPCEIGCVRYSLQEGITADFHSFINPGEGPAGQVWAAERAGVIVASLAVPCVFFRADAQLSSGGFTVLG